MTSNFFVSALLPMAFLLLLLLIIKRSITKSDKDTERFFLVSIVVISGFLIFTYIALLYIKDVFTPPLITVGSVDAWIGFAGSILGAVITVYAISFTIGNERKIRIENEKRDEVKRKEQLAQDLIPIITVGPRLEKDYHNVSTTCGDTDLSIQFKINNISENHARNISIKNHSMVLLTSNHRQVVDLCEAELEKLEAIQLLPSKAERFFKMPIASSKMDNMYPELLSQDYVNFEMILNVSAFDVHLLMEHTFVINVKGMLIDNAVDPIIFIYDENGDSDGELYNKYLCRITSCLTDLE